MVKDTGVTQPTDKIRLGRFTGCAQPHNSIVLNATYAKIDNIENSGLYVTPIRNAAAPNLLAYDPATKEIVETGGHKIKIPSLEVENLDVVNSRTVENYYTSNPVFEIAKGNTKNDVDVGIVMRRHGGDVKIQFSEKNNCLAINKDTDVKGTIKAKIFEGDAGLLSNIQINHEIPDTFENLTVTKSLNADGSLLSNISIKQLNDLENATLNLESLYTQGSIHSSRAIVSSSKVVAPIFQGDGTHLHGVALDKDLKSNASRIENIEVIVPELKTTIDSLSQRTKSLYKIDLFETNLSNVANNVENLSYLPTRIGDVEQKLKKFTNTDKKFTEVNKKIKLIGESIPDVSQLRQDVFYLNEQVPIIEKLEDDIKDIKPIKDQLSSTFTHFKNVSKELEMLPILDTRIQNVEEKCVFKDDLGDIQDVVKKIAINTPKRINTVEKNTLNQISDIKNQLLRIDPLEKLVPSVEGVETEVLNINCKLPIIDERIQVLEDFEAPEITLETVMKNESNTSCTMILENPGTSLSTVGNVGFGTTEAASKVTIYETPDIVSPLGEVKAIKINELAEINAYTKANAGLSSGRPGGIVFNTKRPNGHLQPSMTIDGNGSVTVGSEAAHSSAAFAVNSTSRGLLLPRMTTKQIEDIKKPEPGLMIYDTEKDTFVGYKKTGWTELC